MSVSLAASAVLLFWNSAVGQYLPRQTGMRMRKTLLQLLSTADMEKGKIVDRKGLRKLV
jgi:hypothetical protein